MSEYILFVDGETDGLYGNTLSIASVVLDNKGNEIAKFYEKINISRDDIKSKWVRDNVYDKMGECISHNTEMELLESFWHFYERYYPCICISDVPYPVEANIFRKCIMNSHEERCFKGPFPLLDISSMLYVKGINPLEERSNLIDCDVSMIHNALEDVYNSIALWKQYCKQEIIEEK